MHRDLLWAIRWLRHNPLFTLAITAILALGIGANTAVFSVVDAVLLRPLPYLSPGSLLAVKEATTQQPEGGGMSASDYLLWRDRTSIFRYTAPYLMDIVTLTGIPEPDQVNASRTSPALFSLLGVRAQMGRGMIAADDAPQSPGVVVLSQRLWQRLFHADPSIVGRSLTVSGEACTIVGIMPPEFEFPAPYIDLWTQLRITPASRNHIEVLGRLNDHISIPRAEGELAPFARQLESQDPVGLSGLRIRLAPWREYTWQKYELTLIVILAAVALVLLIACADVGALLLSRAVQRQKEIAIRGSLGAGAGQVLRQLLAESLVLALLGSTAGIAVARVALRYLSRQAATLPLALPHLQRVAWNGRVLVFNSLLCALLACVCSVVPAVFAFRTDLQTALRGAHGSAPSRHSSRLFSLLIAAQAAFAVVLLVGSSLMIRSLIRLQQADHGFRPDHVLTLRVPVGSTTQPRPTGQYDGKPRQMAYYRQLLDRLQSIPGVRSIAIVNNPPLTNVNTTNNILGPDGHEEDIPTRTISPAYFSAMGIDIVAGRSFSDADREGAPPVAILNQSLARHLFPGRDPLGQILRLPDPTAAPLTVVGIVKDSSQMSYEGPAKVEMYRSYQQFIFGVFMSTLVVRTSGDPYAVANTIRHNVWDVDPNQPILKVASMNDVISDAIWRPRFSAWIFSILGGLALVLTAAGIYSVVAYTTSLRAREIGIRVALGATPATVVGAVLRAALLPLAGGLAAGLASALCLSRFLSTLLYEISAFDPASYLGAAGFLLLFGALASAPPACRAAVGDPLQVLRE